MSNLNLTKSLLCSFSLVFCFHSTVKAGSVTASDGGHAVVCKTGETQSVQLLDFYEFQGIKGAKLDARLLTAKSPESISEIFTDNLVRRVNKAFSIYLPMVIQEVSKNVVFAQTPLVLRDDFGFLRRALPPNCQIQQLARRHKVPDHTGEVWVELDAALFKKLSPLEQEAMFVHEALHWRYFTDRSSENVRTAVIIGLLDEDFYMSHQNEFRFTSDEP